MKKIILGLALLITGSISLKAQGVEGFIVEKFYVTNAADNAGNGTTGTVLPTGSVVWRFYVDMAAGWELQSVYGDPNHTLNISTTTAFFNNIDRGEAFAHSIPGNQMINNTNYIDSYLSLGGASSNRLGILKSEDDAVNNIAFAGGYLQNNNASAGQLLTARDGSFNTVGTPVAITPAGLTLGVFGPSQAPIAGNSFTTSSGAWASTVSCVGPTATNRVLIAQITSDGVLTYAFNVQVRNITTLAVENYVPSSPVSGEIALPTLAGVVNQVNASPVVNITAPTAGSTYLTGQPVIINATATDADGTIAPPVEFLVDGIVVGTSAVAPYTFTWTSTVGSHNLTVRATDNLGAITTSSAVNIVVGNVIPPTVNITSPSSGATFVEGDLVAISANATDDGTVTQVEFFVNGVTVGVDNTGPAPFTFTWTSVQGNATLTAVATDNSNATTTSAGVSISVFDSSSAYSFISATAPCSNNTFCLPINALVPANDVIGYDLVVQFDNTEVQPTGVVTVANDLLVASGGAAITSTANSIDLAGGKMYISVFFNASAPANAEFNGTGELLCVQFVRQSGFLAADTTDISLLNGTLQESYYNGVQPKVVSPGQYATFQDGSFESSLKFWFDNSPIKYDIANTAAYLITNIKGSTVACTPLSATAVQPDLNGNFIYDYSNGTYINIDKNIPLATSVQPVVNGFDAFFTRRLLINDVTFVPSVYQMVAMDVNTDGVVSAGDLSQINLRAVLAIGEFRQDWNYSPAGVPLNGPNTSKDWLFIDGISLNQDPNYLISTTFPFDDGVGYSRFRSPQIDFCLQVPIQTSTSCNVFEVETYTGVLLGDVNGNYATVANNGPYRLASDKVIFDLSKAVVGNGFIDVPVNVMTSGDVNAIDFALSFNESKMSFGSVINTASAVETLANYNTEDKSLRFTSYSLQNYDLSNAVVMVRFQTLEASINVSDLNNLEGYINGDRVAVEVIDNNINNDVLVNVFPNPASSSINVIVSENASVQLMDANGRLISEKSDINAYQKHVINTENLAKGIYMLKVYNNNMVSVKKVVIE